MKLRYIQNRILKVISLLGNSSAKCCKPLNSNAHHSTTEIQHFNPRSAKSSHLEQIECDG